MRRCNGWNAGLRKERCGLTPWSGSFCFVLRQESKKHKMCAGELFWQPDRMLGVTLQWTRIPSRGGGGGSNNTPSATLQLDLRGFIPHFRVISVVNYRHYAYVTKGTLFQ